LEIDILSHVIVVGGGTTVIGTIAVIMFVKEHKKFSKQNMEVNPVFFSPDNKK